MTATDPFRPAWWCRNPHWQTLWPHVFRRRPGIPGSSASASSCPTATSSTSPGNLGRTGPLVLVLHGLEGSLRSHYAAGLIDALIRAGYRVAFMHFRNCSGEPNRLPRSYHSGDTADLQRVVEHVTARTGAPAVRRGRLLARRQRAAEVARRAWRGGASPTAVAVSVPFLLGEAADRMERGWSRLYQYPPRRPAASRATRASSRACPRRCRSTCAAAATDLPDLRRPVTAPLHGFAGVDDYYARSSSRQFLRIRGRR